ncbi:MAG: hypothetical protein ACOC33_00425 [bacterium]
MVTRIIGIIKTFWKTRRKDVIFIGVLLILLSATYFFYAKHKNIKLKYNTEKKLSNALSDSIRIIKDENGDLSYEKLTLQTKLNRLENQNINLSKSQRELINYIKQQDNNKEVISAALIEMKAEIKNLKDNNPNIVNDSTISFEKKSDTLNYKFRIKNVQPFNLQKPSLEITYLNIPTQQFISFNWDKNRRDDFPISFNVKYSNPLFTPYTIESYAIPELQKTQIKPNFFDKVGEFTNKTGIKLTIFGVGLGAGYLLSR